MSNTQTQVAVGAYTDFSCQISEEAKKVFNKAFEGFVSVEYVPVAVATQVVSGTNYAFFCNAKGIYPGAITQPAMVYIYADLDGNIGQPEIKIL